MADGEQSPTLKSRTSYCPRCHTRYAYDAGECVTCSTALVAEQPRDGSVFRPKTDLPFLAFAVLFLGFYNRLPGEARSFGAIFLIVGAATLVTFRYIRHAEWIGRR